MTLRPLLGSSFPLDQRCPWGCCLHPSQRKEEGTSSAAPLSACGSLSLSCPPGGRRSEDPVLGLCSDPDVVLWGRRRPLAPAPKSQGWAGGLSCRGGEVCTLVLQLQGAGWGGWLAWRAHSWKPKLFLVC